MDVSIDVLTHITQYLQLRPFSAETIISMSFLIRNMF
jgi:hypothetical protein